MTNEAPGVGADPDQSLLEDGDGLLDWPALQAWIATSSVPGTGPVVACRQLAGGTQNNLFELTREDGSTTVLRRPPRHPRPKSDETMLREARLRRRGQLTSNALPREALVLALALPLVAAIGVVPLPALLVDLVSPANGATLARSLPDGVPGWLPADAFKRLNEWERVHVVSYAQRFLGVPYLWAGKTVKGFDCSGFTQFVHKMFAISMRRDAWMQFEDGRFVSDNPLEGQPGDLMFFAESGDKVTHVGFCLGKGKVLHARGMVRVNTLQQADPLFSSDLLKNFVGIRSFL